MYVHMHVCMHMYTDTHAHKHAQHTKTQALPARCDGHMNSSIASDLITSKYIQSIDTDYHLRPWTGKRRGDHNTVNRASTAPAHCTELLLYVIQLRQNNEQGQLNVMLQC